MRYTMINGTGDGGFELLCFEGDDCVWEQTFGSESSAEAYGARFLDGEFRDGFILEAA